VAEGLERAHSADIVHRDIKPANLMLTQRGEVVIVDFGLAKLAGELSLTKSGSSLGTPHYMSAEQARGDRVDGRTDLWSLGVVLFEMLTGQRPFRGENNTAVARAILDDEPPLLADLRPEAPPELGAIVAKALEKDAHDRYQSAGEFLADLKGLQDQLSEREGLTEAAPSRVPTRRRPYLAPVLVAAALFIATVAVVWFLRSGVVKEPVDTTPPRIVVLPFENLGSPDDEYFADGMTEEIISRLSAVSGLLVISRTSAMYYKGRQVPLNQIGEELNVQYALEGTVRWERTGEGHGRVRITPQLIKVADDTHLWSDRYDRAIESVFEVQSDIAEQVVGQLHVAILEPERRAVEAGPTENMEAYQAFLLGNRYRLGSWDEKYLWLTVEMFERAIQLDPGFAVAHAALSIAHSRLFHFRYDFTTERLDKARMFAERALELQPNLPEAHLAFGYYHYWGQRDYDRALEEFSIAAKGLPNDPALLGGMFAVFRRQGKWDDAVKVLDRRQRADPQSYRLAMESSLTYMYLREFEMAEREMRRAIAISPDLPDAIFTGAWNFLLWDGSTERARELLATAPSTASSRIEFTAVKLDLYDRTPESALVRLEEAQTEAYSYQDSYTPTTLLECVALADMGDGQGVEVACGSALELLEREIEDRPHDHRLYAALGHALAILGRDEEAVRVGEHAAELMPISKDALEGPRQVIELAKIYARVGQHDKAMDLIEELLAIPSWLSVGLLRLDPVWDPLRDHPRFQALLEKYDTG